MKKRTEAALVFLLVLTILAGANLFALIAKFSIKSVPINECLSTIGDMCWVRASNTVENTVFNFSVFLTSIALLVILYTLTDERFKFRTYVAPIPLIRISYWTLILTGLGSLTSDLWFSYHLPIPQILNSQIIWQFFFGSFFFIVISLWIAFGFIWPPVFSTNNYKHYSNYIFRCIVKGDEPELRVLAEEMTPSADRIVAHSRHKITPELEGSISHYANEILLMLGNKKFCEAAVYEPSFAITLFYQIGKQKKLGIPVDTFARNFAAAAISNKQSSLYHEESGYVSGLTGYVKPLTRDVFGNHRTCEYLNGAPFDISYTDRDKWDYEHFAVYLNCVLAVLESYLEQNNGNYRSQSLINAFSTIKHAFRPLYYKNIREDKQVQDEFISKLMAFGTFFDKALSLIENTDPYPRYQLRYRGEYSFGDHSIHGMLANLYFEVGKCVSKVKEPKHICWEFQYGNYWSKLTCGSDSEKTIAIIRFKVRRIFYDEIYKMKKHPNYENASLLGMMLNLFSFELNRQPNAGDENYPLRKAIIEFAIKHLHSIASEYPALIDTLTTDGTELDMEKAVFIKYYRQFLWDKQVPKKVLHLNKANMKNFKYWIGG